MSSTETHARNASRVARALLAAAAVVCPSALWAATATIGAVRDNSIFESSPTNSGGGSAGIFAGTNGMGSPRRGLIAFDIAGNLPPGSTITAVQLTLYLGNAPNSDSRVIGLHRLTKDWGEGTAGSTNPSISMSGMGYPANPGDATWDDAMFEVGAWSAAGAAGDYHPTASATSVVSGPIDTPFTWDSTAALVSDVQGWLDTPTTNFGWALINADEEITRSIKAFYSREATQNSSGQPNSLDPTWRPMLMIGYLEPVPPNGDYNGNGVVDAADYVLWRKTYDMPAVPNGSGADGNSNGIIDDGDFIHWRNRFGQATSGSGGGQNVPEPHAAGCVLLALGILSAYRRSFLHSFHNDRLNPVLPGRR